MGLLHHLEAHRARGARDHAGGTLEVLRVQVLHLLLRDLEHLLHGDLAHVAFARRLRALLDAGGLLEEEARGRRLGDEGEAAVAIGRDHHRDRHAGLQTLGLRVERLAELHDVEAALSQRRANRRRRVRLPRRHLELDVAHYFLRHTTLRLTTVRPSTRSLRSLAQDEDQGVYRSIHPHPEQATLLGRTLMVSAVEPRRTPPNCDLSDLLHLRVLELDRRRAAEDRDRDLDARLLLVDLLDHAVERGEGEIGDPHLLAHLESDRGLWPLDAFLDLANDPLRLGLGDRHRPAAATAAQEVRHLRRILHEVPRLVRELHLHQHVAREELPLRADLGAALYLDDFLGRHQHLLELVGDTLGLRLLADRLRDLLLEAGIDVHDVPPHRHELRTRYPARNARRRRAPRRPGRRTPPPSPPSKTPSAWSGSAPCA